jgi:hypothetical protein
VVKSGSVNSFAHLNIPKSRKRDWHRKGPVSVVSAPEFDLSNDELLFEIDRLKRELAEATAKSDLITTTVKTLGFQLQFKGVPSAEINSKIIRAVKIASVHIGLNTSLDLVKLSKARFSAWLTRQKRCSLEDRQTCGRLSPTRLLNREVSKIKEMIVDPAYRHFSVASLAIYAARKSLDHASESTWHRVIKQFELKRSGKRHYPAKPRVGIRASAPNQIWHLDLSVIKLKDGTRCYIQALIDNFSRFVLAWQTIGTYGGESTKSLIEMALSKARELSNDKDFTPNLIVDGGSENNNTEVNDLVSSNLITKSIAQLEIDFSNSMIESLFLRLKHWHLYFQELTSFEKLKEHTDFYLEQCNHKIPMAVLKGATPFEAYTGNWSNLDVEQIREVSLKQKTLRVDTNLKLRCSIC